MPWTSPATSPAWPGRTSRAATRAATRAARRPARPTLAPPRPTASLRMPRRGVVRRRRSAPLGLEIDDDVRERAPVALSRARDHALFEPVRAPRGMGGDHDLVGSERAQGVVDRLH